MKADARRYLRLWRQPPPFTLPRETTNMGVLYKPEWVDSIVQKRSLSDFCRIVGEISSQSTWNWHYSSAKSPLATPRAWPGSAQPTTTSTTTKDPTTRTTFHQLRGLVSALHKLDQLPSRVSSNSSVPSHLCIESRGSGQHSRHGHQTRKHHKAGACCHGCDPSGHPNASLQLHPACASQD